MPLRQQVDEFTRCCNAMIEALNGKPELLTESERLDIETGVTRVMATVVAILERKDRPGPSSTS